MLIWVFAVYIGCCFSVCSTSEMSTGASEADVAHARMTKLTEALANRREQYIGKEAKLNKVAVDEKDVEHASSYLGVSLEEARYKLRGCKGSLEALIKKELAQS